MRNPAKMGLSPGTAAPDGPAWATARQRVRLYLQALSYGPEESARLERLALETAAAEHPAVPVTAAMAVLDRLLSQEGAAVTGAVSSQPSFQRAPMVPEHLERRPLSFFFGEVALPAGRALKAWIAGALARPQPRRDP